MNTPGTLPRIDYIDYVRGIAALLVMLQHCLEAAGIVHLDKGALASSVVNFGETGVVAFFLVSGYIIPFSLEKKGSLSKFWTSRAFRIYPMYMVAFVLGCLTVFDFSHVGMARALLAHLLFVQEFALHDKGAIVPNSWTLSLEMVWYILFSCLFAFGMNRKHILIGVGCAATLLALSAFSLIASHTLPMGRFGMLGTCVVGFLFYRRQHGHISARLFALLAGGIGMMIALGLAARFYWMPDNARGYEISLQCVLTSWGLAYAIFFAFAAIRHGNFWGASYLAWLGKISYSVYLLHPVFLFAAHRLGMESAALIAFVFGSTILASYYTYRFIESPAMALGHRLSAVPRPVVP
jgi:peptidoglycan/LPS O-acetylase OafA/YrhL